MPAFTVAGTVTDASGNTTSWSASATVGATVTALHDFGVDNSAQPGVSFWQKTGAFNKGTNPVANVYQMPPMTSTKANVSDGTTPWFLMMFGGGSSSAVATDLEVCGFTLQGTPQPGGLWQHGLRIGYSNGAKVHDVIVKGSVGAGSSPPQETFAFPLWHADNFTLTDVVLDGRDTNANAVAGTLLGYNYCGGNTVARRVKANYTTNGFGAALFGQTGGTHLFDHCDFAHNRKAINIEGNSGGTFIFDTCDFSDVQGATYHMQGVAGTGPVTIRVNDPIITGTGPFTVYVGPNQAVKPTVVLIRNGVDVSNDPTKLKIVNQG